MRVIGGEWRGRTLLAPAGRATRPTSDKVREAIFDVLGALLASGEWAPPALAERGVDDGRATGPLAGVEVVDLYAGSGALGIEALSRGAAHCTFVESGPGALGALRANLARLPLRPGRADVVPAVAADLVAAGSAPTNRYNLLFADPPYARMREEEGAIGAVVDTLLAPGSVAVLEMARDVESHLGLREVQVKVYGATKVVFGVAGTRTSR